MNLSLYSSATGMEAQQLRLDTIANNIANVNTTGFKTSKIEFQDILYQNPRPVGADAGTGNPTPTGIELGNGAKVISTSKMFTQGELTQTDAQMDLAIEGSGFLQIQRADGTTAYTRDGALKLGPAGEVITNNGMTVLGFGQIPTDATGISVSPTGQVTVNTPNGQTQFQIQIARFPNPGGLRSLGGNLYQETEASGAAEVGTPGANGYGSLHQGFLEMSNVNVVQEMINMIVAQRAYEMNSKSIQSSDEMLAKIAQLKR